MCAFTGYQWVKERWEFRESGEGRAEIHWRIGKNPVPHGTGLLSGLDAFARPQAAFHHTADNFLLGFFPKEALPLRLRG